MKLFVIAKPSARKESIEQIDQTHFKISVREKPENGEANAAIAAALAEYLGISRSCITLRFGQRSRRKVFEVVEE